MKSTRKETTHEGLTPFRNYPKDMVRAIDDDGGLLMFHDLGAPAFVFVTRASWHHHIGLPVGTPTIEINAAPPRYSERMECHNYESLLVPRPSRECWRLAWSIVRKLASATPGRRAIVEAWEWMRAFAHVELSHFHRNSIGTLGAFPTHFPRWNEPLQLLTAGATAATH
jgi:hypothetical protein